VCRAQPIVAELEARTLLADLSIATVAGNGKGVTAGGNKAASQAELAYPRSVAVDAHGNLFIADSGANVIDQVSAATGKLTRVAGNGIAGYSGDGGKATAAELNGPRDIAVDSAGDLFIADTYNNVVREVAAGTGVITTVAGDGTPGYTGNSGQANFAELNSPFGVAVDAYGDLFIADAGNNVVREVINSTISTIAGNGSAGYTGDHGSATVAELNFPASLALDSQGDLFISDEDNNVIREVTASSGKIKTVAGTGTAGYSGDHGLATAALLSGPVGIAVDSSGNLFIADLANNVVREVKAATGRIVTVAGDSTAGYSGDDGLATNAELNSPEGVAVDSFGVLYIADAYNERVRVLSPATGVISTFAGNGLIGYTGDGGPASAAALIEPVADAVDQEGDIFSVDFVNNVIRKVTPAG
jgi:streptogramin lyase